MPRKTSQITAHFILPTTAQYQQLACFFARRGIEVSASSVNEQKDWAKNSTVRIVDESIDNIKKRPDYCFIDPTLDVLSTEVKQLRQTKILKQAISELLATELTDRQIIGVLGTHYRSLTAQYLLALAQAVGFAPGQYVVGNEPSFNEGSGDWFVVSESESLKAGTTKPKMDDFRYSHILLTALNYDLPSEYAAADAVYVAYYSLLAKLPRGAKVIMNSDWPLLRRLAFRFVDRTVITVGVTEGSTYVVQLKELSETHSVFSLKRATGEIFGPYTIDKVGLGPIQSAALAVVYILEQGTPKGSIPDLQHLSLNSTTGNIVKIGAVNLRVNEETNPFIVQQELTAVTQRDQMSVVVYRPNGYIRTQKLLSAIADSLKFARHVVLLPIEGEPMEKSGYFTNQEVLQAIKEQVNCELRVSLSEVWDYLQTFSARKDQLLYFGHLDETRD